MLFTPLTPAALVDELAGWIRDLDTDHPRIGFDGPAEIGTPELADAVAARLRTLGRSAHRVSTQWWWRPASLRLELGRTDVDMLLAGWVDAAALRREVLDPLGPGGNGAHLLRLRDPETDRSIREAPAVADARTALLLDGPFLLAAALPLDAIVHLQVSPATLARALPPDRRWWLAGFARYLTEEQPVDRAQVVLAYDHPAAPAIGWPIAR